MSLDAIKRVAQAEAEAEGARAEHIAAAKKLLADTETAGKAAFESRRGEVEAQNAEKIASAEREAAIVCDGILAEADEDCRALKAKAEKRLKDARALIVGRVVGR